MNRFWRIFVFSCLAMALPVSAMANPWEYIGFNGATMSMGNAAIADASGPAAAFYNPAGFMRGKVRGGELTFFTGLPLLELDAAANTGLQETSAIEPMDIDAECGTVPDAEKADCEKTVGLYNRYVRSASEHLAFNDVLLERARSPRNLYGLTIGGVLPVAYDPKDALLSVGGAVFLPIGPVIYQRLKSPTVPFFLRYDDGPHRFVGNVGGALELPFGIRLGAGLDILADVIAGAEIDLFVPPELQIIPQPNLQDIRFIADGSLEVKVAVSPMVGIQVEPVPWIAAGLAYRHKQQVDIEVNGDIVVRSGREAESRIPLSVATSGTFTPSSLGGGVSVRPFDGFKINLDASWKKWEDYSPPFSVDLQVSNIADGACSIVDNIEQLDSILDGMPDEVRDIFINDEGDIDLCNLIKGVLPSSVNVNPYQSVSTFSNTVEPAVGVQYEIDIYSISAGYKYQPTPIPDQTGIYNIMDSNTHVVSGGFGVALEGFHVNLFSQYRILQSRTINKLTTGGTTTDDFSGVEQDVLPDASFSYSNAGIEDRLEVLEDATDGVQYANPLYPGYTIGGGYLTLGLELGLEF